MSSPVVVMRPTEPVAHAKNLMLRHGIKRIVVMEHGTPVGIVSMKDLAEHLGRGTPAWRRRPIDQIPIARVMSTKLITVSPSTDMGRAAEMLLKHGISSLIVTEDKHLMGILTKTDLARFFAEKLGGRAKVRELMSKNVVTVGRLNSLAHVVELMEKNNITRVVVVDGMKPVGIVTASDVAFARLETPGRGVATRRIKFTRRPERADRPRYRYVKYVAMLTAEDVMNPELLTIEADEDAARAARLMLEHGISGLPVVEQGELVGIITKTDLTRGAARFGG
jgi:CBS domain-containing protein